MKPLNKTSDLLVLDFINELNPDAELELSQVTLGDPAVNDGDDADDRNSKMTVKARKNSGYIGEQAVTYNRLEGSALFRNVTAYLDVKEPKSTTDLLAMLNTQYGLNITADDITPTAIPDGVNVPPTDPEAADPVPVDHDIVFTDECYAFLGKIAVKIGAKPQVGERLSLVITKTQLDGLQYPDEKSDTKGQAYIYSYGVDCTAIAAFLKVQAEGTLAADSAFASELNKVVPELWVDKDTAEDYNVHEAEVTYNGNTVNQVSDGNGGTKDEAVEGANTEYNSILKLKLSDTLCSNFQGELFLHYNA
ncbi:hypothetical protein pEaSNUABM11_00165 [Erwinia phage pEa_SNUABM_11]|nr:hypothetical protein pEaSNUABM11_00165 [Erwinia phage pEa_SNUABM_11]